MWSETASYPSGPSSSFTLLEQIIDGTADMKTGAGRNLGTMKIVRALAQYGEYFDHAGWQPLDH